tara:strand:- start:69 stop:1022 length:954 start_codon:yes stop_codon:yes gene_type:complete
MPASSPAKVSVVIPCFNDGAYLAESVGSVLAQQGGFELCEVLVVDDGSDDPQTLEALTEIAKHPKVITAPNEEQKGPGGARNTGVRRATGDWIVFLDSDDILCDGSIDARLRAAAGFPGSRWVGGDFIILNEDGILESETFFRSRPQPRRVVNAAFETGAPILLSRPVREFIENPPTNMCCTMAKKDLIEAVGGFDPTQRLQQDFHLFIRMAYYADFVFVPQPVMHYRLHSGNSTRSSLNTLRWRETACRKLLADATFATYAAALKRKISEVNREISVELAVSGSQWSSMQAALRSLVACPENMAGWKRLAASLVFR